MTVHATEPVHRIVYLSRAAPGLDEVVIDALVQTARHKNGKLGITGALLFERGHFFQVLEGPGKQLRALFRAILNDDRHERVRLLIEDDLATRQFASWSLAWNRENDRTLSEHFRELEEAVTSTGSTADDLETIQKFLVVFHGLLSAQATTEPAGADSVEPRSHPW